MSENPYESPNSPNGAPQSRGWSAGRIVYFIFILILAIPASLIAAMTLCFVTGGITKPTNIVSHATKINIGLMVGAITAVLTFILIFRSAIKRLGP